MNANLTNIHVVELYVVLSIPLMRSVSVLLLTSVVNITVIINLY